MVSCVLLKVVGCVWKVLEEGMQVAFAFVFFSNWKQLEQKQESGGSLESADLLHDLLVQLVVFESCGSNWYFVSDLVILELEMAGAMKAMKAKAQAMKAKKVSTAKVMTKGGLTGELANSTELKKADISTILNTLAEIGTKEVKKSGKFVLPGLVMIKTRDKPAKKAGIGNFCNNEFVTWASRGFIFLMFRTLLLHKNNHWCSGRKLW